MISRYIDPTTDFGFKRLFGQEDSKEILKRFLFDVLDLSHPIRELSYLPIEQLPLTPEERRSIYDVYCLDEAGQRFIVEMQRGWQANFKERSLYYSTFPITHQAEKGSQWGYELLPIYCLAILNFQMEDDARYVRRVQLADVETGETFYDKLTFVFIELPKFERTLAELTTAADKWIYLLKRMPELQDIPAELAEAPFTEAFATAEQSALSPQERWVYEASLKQARDYTATLKGAEWKGHEKGLKEGREEGREETQKEIARSMLAQGLDTALIAELTNLSEAEVAALRPDET